MSRAAALAVAADYLFQAVNALDSAAQTLDRVGALGAADQVRGLHEGTKPLQQEIRRAANTAHRVERPEFYDESGQWVGRQDQKGKI
ncbi:hypothetical protein ACQEVI_19755 [Promicromonospora sp. CA-289599]|uniref:hypothetical protein n=1 Tax=Promicromonospora sp. CA-289599 TaxID=3240014 RepID=UPI003D918547